MLLRQILSFEGMIKMKKTPFTYRRWTLMHFCSLIMILPIASIQYLIAIILNMEHTSFWYSMICTVVAFTGITFFTNTLNVSAGLKEKVLIG